MGELGIGVIGCGGFGFYAMQQYAKIPNVNLIAVSDPNRAAAERAAKHFGLIDAPSVDSLCQRPDVDLVYIASPPFLHHRHAIAALTADKHVVCEKPLALSLAQADEMIAFAKASDRIVVANLIQRYNPLADRVGKLIANQILGKPLHGYFENYASDEQLATDHWFWDPEKSGGIFVEHGVHFFDLFASWLGNGEVVAAQRCLRQPRAQEDQVQCCVRYRDEILVNFYHGFHQTARMDRQEIRIVFERGDVTLHGWIPTRLSLDAIVSDADEAQLVALFPDATLDLLESYFGEQRVCHGRHEAFPVDRRIRISTGQDSDKMNRYGELVRALMEDQLKRISEPSHQRRLTELHSREALRMAVQANRLASQSSAPNCSPLGEVIIHDS
ncbi:1,5-anhydro-D-fructose reductase [Novipirellula galeiformis]|uniref:1,5-anhydro-D-fructose reductase n=1 Tax=Novipirellula galeiformis TaxID=2528004 RepID=A0A5C6CH82_9BACT|nr:Gfo/Idh/MocA family oxidoreductase [Novipirellula galeiformis]TWU23385.1 1,5-anhydro-D-fructose reductase [Novipirellula galeiformis]